MLPGFLDSGNPVHAHTHTHTHTHTPCSRLIDCVEEDKSHQHFILMAQAYICANDQ